MSYTPPGAGAGASWPAGPTDTPSPPGGHPARPRPGARRAGPRRWCSPSPAASRAGCRPDDRDLVPRERRRGRSPRRRRARRRCGRHGAGRVHGPPTPAPWRPRRPAAQAAPTPRARTAARARAPAGAGLPAVTIPGESTAPTTIPGSSPTRSPSTSSRARRRRSSAPWSSTSRRAGTPTSPCTCAPTRRSSCCRWRTTASAPRSRCTPPTAARRVVEGWRARRHQRARVVPPDEPLPATGTYVIRAIHTGGSHEPFVLGFFEAREAAARSRTTARFTTRGSGNQHVDERQTVLRRTLVRDRGEARPRRPRPNRVGLRPVQRPHRAAGQPRRGRPHGVPGTYLNSVYECGRSPTASRVRLSSRARRSSTSPTAR